MFPKWFNLVSEIQHLTNSLVDIPLPLYILMAATISNQGNILILFFSAQLLIPLIYSHQYGILLLKSLEGHGQVESNVTINV